MIQHILNHAQAFKLLIYFSLYFSDQSLQHLILWIKYAPGFLSGSIIWIF